MTTDTSERGLERLICTALTGHPCDPPQESRVAEVRPGYGGAGWSGGNPHDYNISRANVVTMATVSQGVLASCPVFLPSISEQEGLLKQIDGECVRVSATHDRARLEIDLLREYRTRLIADVVTGKIDVRAAAARLPDEAQDPEPLDETDAITDGEDEPTDDLDAVAAGAEV